MRFPPLTPAVRALLIALVGLFVLGAVLQKLLHLLPVFELLSLATTHITIATSWQLLTHVFAIPAQQGVELSLLLSLAFIWLILAPFEARYGQSRVWQLVVVSALASGVPALLTGMLVPSMAGQPLAGPATITLAAVAGYVVLLPPHAEVSFFGVFPMRAKHMMAIVVGMSVIRFLTSSDAAQLAADLGAIAGGIGFCKWLQRTPRRRAKRPAGVRGGGHLHAVKGGAGDEEKDPKRWLN